MYGGTPYASGAYAGAGMVAADIPVDVEPTFSVEVAFTTSALATPAWVDISHDVRSWDVSRGRTRELERFQPGRLTVVLDNSDRAYDSQHATGPHFGNLRPMRRIRIRETFNGVTYPRFDGFVDRWNLDYPDNVDAVATVVATDGFKVLARTDVGRSVYTFEVEADDPDIWYRLQDDLEGGEELLVASNSGSLGSAGDGAYFGNPGLNGETLVVNDPGASIATADTDVFAGTPKQFVKIVRAKLDLVSHAAWAVEMWVRPNSEDTTNQATLFENNTSGVLFNVFLVRDAADPTRYRMQVANTVPTIFSVVTATGVSAVGQRNHVVARKASDGQLSIVVDGVVYTLSGGDSGTVVSGTLASGDVTLGGSVVSAARNFAGNLSEFAVYTAGSGDALSLGRIQVHNRDGRIPWKGDLPGARADRVLDRVGWPASLRELDAGETTFQSATLNTPVLEHLQKVGETEAGTLFMNRAGFVRLVDRDALAARVSQATFGDLAPEIGYRSVTFDDGDQTLRNRATISRLNGVAKVSTGTLSVEEFGRFDYVLDGLLHDTDAHSLAYAAFIVSNYQEPQRRVVSLELGPASAGQETALYDQILGRELGDKITVKVRHPDGTGVVFSQDVVIEGMSDRWDPHGFRAATWALSPAPGTF